MIEQIKLYIPELLAIISGFIVLLLYTKSFKKSLKILVLIAETVYGNELSDSSELKKLFVRSELQKKYNVIGWINKLLRNWLFDNSINKSVSNNKNILNLMRGRVDLSVPDLNGLNEKYIMINALKDVPMDKSSNIDDIKKSLLSKGVIQENLTKVYDK